jgi:tetratricopeptide (TPR) repeat protein
MSALSKMDAGHMDSYPRWQFADLMNHVAYTLLSVYKNNMGDDFDYLACIEYAKGHFDNALSIIESITDEDIYMDAKLAEAQIYGNLGAYCLAKNKATNEKEWIRNALEYHHKGLNARQIVFGDKPESGEGCGFIGTSYNCLATDYFMLGDYEQSYENHKQAISFREIGGAKDIRKLESYTRCIGTLSKLLIAGCAEEQCYLDEAFVLLKKALMLDAEQHQLMSLDCLLRNRYELNNLKNGCGNIISYINKHRDVLAPSILAEIKTIALKIDALCDELSIESNLHKQIL